jgi:hypothetical protein
MMAGSDAFDCPLASAYDPSYPLIGYDQLPFKEEVPKLEEPTSPGYLVEQALPSLPELALPPPERQPKILKSKRISKPACDDDYKPNKRAGRAGKGVQKQKEDRNLIPNTMHHLLAFVQKQFKSSYLVEKLLPAASPNADYSLPRFYNFHRMLRTQVNNYVNEEAMRTITEPGLLPAHEYGEQEQAFYCYLSRLVIRKFLKEEAVLMILLSRKVRRENIRDHLSVQRFLYENMRAIRQL